MLSLLRFSPFLRIFAAFFRPSAALHNYIRVVASEFSGRYALFAAKNVGEVGLRIKAAHSRDLGERQRGVYEQLLCLAHTHVEQIARGRYTDGIFKYQMKIRRAYVCRHRNVVESQR